MPYRRPALEKRLTKHLNGQEACAGKGEMASLLKGIFTCSDEDKAQARVCSWSQTEVKLHEDIRCVPTYSAQTPIAV